MAELIIPWEEEKEKNELIVPWESSVPTSYIPEDEEYTAGEAMWYATKLGLLDTYRGGKQILNIDEEEEADRQNTLNKLMSHPEYGGRVTAAYFGGMIADPVGWFIPATKARTVAKMAKHGLMWGAGAGAAGYVDPEMESILGEGKLGRGEQALMGAAGGAVITPFMGKMIALGKKGYNPVGEKVWKAVSKNPEIGTGVAGGMIGYNIGEDTTVQEDLRNGLLGILAGATGGFGIRRANRLYDGALGRMIIPDYGLSPEYLTQRGIGRRDANVIARQFNDIAKKFQDETEETRETIYKVLIGELDLDDPIGKLAQAEGWTLKLVGKGRKDFAPNPRAKKKDGKPIDSFGDDWDEIPMSWARKGEKAIYFDPLIAAKKYETKAWRRPKEPGVKALDDSLFPTYRDWENFVKTHELMHTRHPKLGSESKADHENRMNQLAIKHLRENPIDIPMQKLVDDARAAMSKYGKELTDLGVLHPRTFEKNRLTYIHRLFKNPKYQLEKSKAAYMADEEIRSIGDELNIRGRPELISGDDWEINQKYYLDEKNGYDIIGITQKSGDKLTHLDDEMMGKLRREEIHMGSIKSVMLRKDWTPEERVEMGEVTDAAIALNRTGQLMANDVAAHRFFKTISDEYAIVPKRFMTDKGIMHDVKVPDDFNQLPVPNNKAKYGELAGKYLPKNIYHDIVAMDQWRSGAMFKSPVARGYRTLNSWWKLTKTAYNAPVHTNNFSSNIVMYDLNDGSAKALRKAFNDLLFPTARGESARLKLAREHDVFGGNYIGNEILGKNKELFKAYGTSVTGSETVDKIFNKVPNTILKIGKFAKRHSLDKAQELYTWEDNLFRLGLFNTLVEKGVNPVSAAKQAREGFVDYSKSAPMLEALRHSALPFASYAYGIVPRLAEAAAKRPWKFAKWAAIISGVNALGEDLTNDPEKVARERLLMGSDQERRLFELPMAPTTMLKLPPQLSPKGTDGSMYWNIARSIPGQAFQFTDQGHRVPGLPDVMQPTFGALGSLVTGAYGMNLFTGQDIPDAGGRLAEIGKSFTPNIPIPGLPTYAGEKARRGLTPGGFKSQTKENQTLLTATLQNLGIRIQTIDENKLYMKQHYRFREMYDNIAKDYRKLLRDFEEGKYIGRQKKFESSQKNLYKKLESLEEKMMRKGL
tara:strand:- start:271 stop:3738 length:3468 start_codon:yes stop_codon:yes gene_type:complete